MDCFIEYIGVVILLITCFTSLQSVAMDTVEPLGNFDGDKVITVDTTDRSRWLKVNEYLQKMAHQSFEIWQMTHSDKEAHVYLKKSIVKDVENMLISNEISSRELIDNVGRVIREQAPSSHSPIGSRARRHILNINEHYARYNEILDWMDSIAQQYPGVARVLSIGKTFEGRKMRVLKLGIPWGRKWAVWVDGGVHAREWISSSTVIYLAQKLVDGYALHDETVMSYLEHLDWYLLPVMNPDGYEYTHTKNRLWRKNRRPSSNPNCTGVDLNRNFGYMWGGADSNSEPCNRIYRGEYPESELEVQHVVDFITPRADSFIAYLSYHSYGHKFLAPWSYTNTKVPVDHQDVISLAQKATEAIEEVYGVPYMAGTAPELIYPFSGGSADWAKGIAQIKYSYLLEIRDDGRYGFLLPPEQIIPTGEEHWAGVKVIAKEMIHKYGAIRAPELVPEKDNSEVNAVSSNGASREVNILIALVCTVVIYKLSWS